MLRWLTGRPEEDEVRLPILGKNQESTVPGLHLVGDLAGRIVLGLAAAATLSNSSCIGCGICVDVCPVDVLHHDEKAARAAESLKIVP